MSDPETQSETQSQPLIRGRTAQGGSSTRAYKVAGITLLACVLIAGQAIIAYFLLNQRGDIKSLEEQNNDLKVQLTKGRSASVPMQMHIPMDALPELMDISVDEKTTPRAPEKPVPPQATDCQLEAAGLKAVQVPGFRPDCDKWGFYMAKQCFNNFCWCVNPINGQEVPGTMRNGEVYCRSPPLRGSLSRVMSLPEPVN